MIVIVVIQHVRIGIGSGVGGTDLSVGTFVLLTVHLGRCILHQGTVQVAQLFRRDSGREGGHVGPEPGVVAIVFIHFITAHSHIYLMFPEMVGHNALYFRHGIIGHFTRPDSMRSGIRFNLVIYFAVFGDIRIHPQIQLNPFIQHLFYETGGIRETALIPLVGTRIGCRVPSRFQANHGKRETSLFKLGDLILHIPVGEQRRRAVPEAQSPTGRQCASPVIQIIPAHGIQHRRAGKKQ